MCERLSCVLAILHMAHRVDCMCYKGAIYFVFCWLLFFQAEDGIRDLVRSRGLGDVYKRQTTDAAEIGRADSGG